MRMPRFAIDATRRVVRPEVVAPRLDFHRVPEQVHPHPAKAASRETIQFVSIGLREMNFHAERIRHDAIWQFIQRPRAVRRHRLARPSALSSV